MNGGLVTSGVGLGQAPNDWQIAVTGDFNADGTSDILWRSSFFGYVAIWFMNGGAISQASSVGVLATDWTIQNTNAE